MIVQTCITRRTMNFQGTCSASLSAVRAYMKTFRTPFTEVDLWIMHNVLEFPVQKMNYLYGSVISALGHNKIALKFTFSL